MSEAATLGVIRDLFALSMLALLLAMPLYAYLHRQPDTAWNFAGNVLARPYDWRDGVAALLLIGVLFSPLAASKPAVHTVSAASQVSPEYVVLAGTIFMLLIAFLVLAYLRLARGLNPAELFGMRQMSVKTAFLTALGAIVVTYLLMILFKWMLEQGLFRGQFPDSSSQETVETFEHGGLAFRFIMGIAAVIMAPMVEETLFRGFLYGITKRFTDRWFSTLFTSLLFAIMHQHVGSLVPLFVLAVCLALAYEATGCLLVPIFMHAIFNGWNILLLALGSLQ